MKRYTVGCKHDYKLWQRAEFFVVQATTFLTYMLKNSKNFTQSALFIAGVW